MTLCWITIWALLLNLMSVRLPSFFRNSNQVITDVQHSWEWRCAHWCTVCWWDYLYLFLIHVRCANSGDHIKAQVNLWKGSASSANWIHQSWSLGGMPLASRTWQYHLLYSNLVHLNGQILLYGGDRVPFPIGNGQVKETQDGIGCDCGSVLVSIFLVWLTD